MKQTCIVFINPDKVSKYLDYQATLAQYPSDRLVIRAGSYLNTRPNGCSSGRTQILS